MLTIHVEGQEFYDDLKEVFFNTKPVTVKLEHSLISISKWEAHWGKPYLPSSLATGISGFKEEIHYISCMVIGNVPDYIPLFLFKHHSDEIQDYIASPQTATKIFRRMKPQTGGRTVTNELIYYWMTKFNIPFSCDRWHFNRLLTFIDVCNVQESQGKHGKMSTLEAAKQRHALNLARRGK